MNKFIASVAAFAILGTASVHAQEAEVPAHSEPVTIIIDAQKASCGTGRVADMYRNNANKQAKKLARKYEAEGRQVNIVTANRDHVVAGFDAGGKPAPITIRAC